LGSELTVLALGEKNMTAIEKMFEQHRGWLSQSESMVAKEAEYLKEDLSTNTLSALDNVSDSLSMLATYYGIKGVVSVNDGVFSGWDDVSRSIIYRYWALKIRAKSFSKTAFLCGVKTIPNLTNQMGNAGCLLAAFVAADRDDMASPVADVLLGMLTIKGAVDSGYLRQRIFEPFMMWLYSVYSGESVSSEIESVNLGVYQRVIESWDKADDLSFALEELCEYHLSNANDTGRSWDPEFKNPPFDLLPLEIQAIRVVRKKLGFVMPSTNHPLLSLETSSAEHLSIIPDDLSLEVESAYNDLFGS
jgi:hypothetical protein